MNLSYTVVAVISVLHKVQQVKIWRYALPCFLLIQISDKNRMYAANACLIMNSMITKLPEF